MRVNISSSSPHEYFTICQFYAVTTFKIFILFYMYVCHAHMYQVLIVPMEARRDCQIPATIVIHSCELPHRG